MRHREKWFTIKTIQKNAKKRYRKEILFNKPHKWFISSKKHDRECFGIPDCKNSSPEIVAGIIQRFDGILKENELKTSLSYKILLYERTLFPFLEEKDKQSHVKKRNQYLKDNTGGLKFQTLPVSFFSF